MSVSDINGQGAAESSDESSDEARWAHLRKYQYQSGFSGNEGGRKKKGPLEKALEDLVNHEDVAVQLAQALVLVACNPKSKGCVAAQKLIRDRVTGPLVRDALRDEWQNLPDIQMHLVDRHDENAPLPPLPGQEGEDQGDGQGGGDPQPPSGGSPPTTHPGPVGDVSRTDPLDELDTSEGED